MHRINASGAPAQLGEDLKLQIVITHLVITHQCPRPKPLTLGRETSKLDSFLLLLLANEQEVGRMRAL